MDKQELLLEFERLRQNRGMCLGFFLISFLFFAGFRILTLYLNISPSIPDWMIIVLIVTNLIMLPVVIITFFRSVRAWVLHGQFCDDHPEIPVFWFMTRTPRPSVIDDLFKPH
jgi:hypothetical protein